MHPVNTKKKKIRTMEELASTIGISRPTLSRYFQDPESVSLSSRNRIEAALEKVDYVPNFFATKMNRKSTGLIGVIVPYLNDLFITKLLESIEEFALKSDYMVITQSAHGDPELEARAVQNMMSMSADGVIVAPIGQASSLESIERLKDELPIVFVDSRFPDNFHDVDYIGTNNKQSIALIVDYLHRSGDSPIFLGMPPMNSNSLERELAYTSRAHELGFKPEIIPVGVGTPGWEFEEYAYQLMDDHFSKGAYIDRTILCANDRLAIGAIRAANRHKLFSHGSGDNPLCRIAGHDDHPLSAFVSPALTTVSQNTTGMGKAAVEQILNQIVHGKREDQGRLRTFDAELKVRESA